MSSRVVSFAQIESICLLSGLEIASAKHQNLNWNSTESHQIHLNTLDFNVFIIRPQNCPSKASKSQLKFNWIKPNPSEDIGLQCNHYQVFKLPQQNIKISIEIQLNLIKSIWMHLTSMYLLSGGGIASAKHQNIN